MTEQLNDGHSTPDERREAWPELIGGIDVGGPMEESVVKLHREQYLRSGAFDREAFEAAREEAREFDEEGRDTAEETDAFLAELDRLNAEYGVKYSVLRAYRAEGWTWSDLEDELRRMRYEEPRGLMTAEERQAWAEDGLREKNARASSRPSVYAGWRRQREANDQPPIEDLPEVPPAVGSPEWRADVEAATARFKRQAGRRGW